MIGFFKKKVSESRYQDLQKDLRSARIARLPEQHISNAIILSIIIGILIGGVVLAIFWWIGISIIYLISLTVLSGLAGSYGSYRAYMGYPGWVADDRSSKIDHALPHACSFLLAMSMGGASTIEMFRALGKRRDEFGEISREGEAIVRGEENLGYSPSRAIVDVAKTTPSEKFRKFLSRLATIVEAGGNVIEFLSRRCERYYSEAKERQERSLDQLTLYAEVYVIALGLGPFLFVFLWIFIGMMQGGFALLPIQLFVYLGIPLGSIWTILLLDRFSAPRIGKKRFEISKEWEGFTGKERALLRRISRVGVMGRINRLLGSPKQVLSRRPTRILEVSVPLGVILASLCFSAGFAIETAIILGILLSFLPFIPFYELRKKRIERITGMVPDFLASLSSAVSSGLSPSRAIKSLEPARFGALAQEIERMKRDLGWGASITEALSGFERRIRSGLLSRVVTVMEKASKMATEIGDVLRVLATDVFTEVSIRRDRLEKTVLYIVMIYVVFGMTFGGLLFVAVFLEASPGAVALGAGGVTVAPIDVETSKVIFHHAVMIQGFCMGLIAGKFRTGSVLNGLKHAVIMTFLGWLLFFPLISFFQIPAM